ncbi:MAG TPA: hypothetical protein VMT22_17175 [Terriglobales bacterium]|jgi:hypothetical protein|nr:hypothetical protein [Terriglobales bacterium]
MRILVLALALAILSLGNDGWSQKSKPTVRFGVAGLSGTNAHYYVDRQLGLFARTIST